MKKLLFFTSFFSILKAETTQDIIKTINIKEIFSTSPIIYSILFIMSIASVVIWLYTIFTFKMKDVISFKLRQEIRDLLIKQNYDQAVEYCKNKNILIAKIIYSGLQARSFGPDFMVSSMQSEGKRATAEIWQRISILNDITLIAPMLGLLGTVLGMFYAFYDINRSIESLSSLFDGLGIAVGTTVAGLIVALIAMFFYTTSRYRIIRILNTVDNEAMELGNLIKAKE